MLSQRHQRNESRCGKNTKAAAIPDSNAKLGSACPICRSQSVILLKFQGILERTVFRFLSIYPFWCNACDARFYLFSKPSFGPQGSDLQ